jgi:hypothetical protein
MPPGKKCSLPLTDAGESFMIAHVQFSNKYPERHYSAYGNQQSQYFHQVHVPIFTSITFDM